MSNPRIDFLAQIALLNKAEPTANPPSENEISALLDGRLEGSRRDEVMGYIASNENLYRLWISLAEAKVGDENAPSFVTTALQKLSSAIQSFIEAFQTPSFYFGGATTAAVLLGLFFTGDSSFRSTPPPSLDQVISSIANDQSDSNMQLIEQIDARLDWQIETLKAFCQSSENIPKSAIAVFQQQLQELGQTYSDANLAVPENFTSLNLAINTRPDTLCQSI